MYARLSVAVAVQFAIGGSFLPFVVPLLRERGLRYDQIGEILMGTALVMATAPMVWGVLADRWIPVNRLIPALHTIAALVLAGTAASDGTFDLIGLGLLGWFAFGMSTNPLLNALCYHNLEQPKRDFGRVRLWGSIGWMLPSLPIWAWLTWGDATNLGFILFIACAVELGFVAMSPILPHTPPRAFAGSAALSAGGAIPPAHDRFVTAFLELVSRPSFVLLLVAVFAMFWSFGVAFFWAPERLLGLGVQRQWIMPIQSLGPIVEIPLFFALRGVILRLGVFGTLFLGGLFVTGRQLLFVATDSPAMLIASYALVGAGVVYFLITSSLAVDEMAGPRVRATAQTLTLLAGPGLGSMAAHLHSGVAAQTDRGDLDRVFLAGLVAAIAGTVLLPLVAWLERRRRRVG